MNHAHHLPAALEGATPEDRLAAQKAACPVCRLHDHSNDDPFGFDRDSQPVPAWWFCCPRCGTAESQVHVKHWTKDGMDWIKDHAGHIGSFHTDKEAA